MKGKREIFIAGAPHPHCGAGTEAIHQIDLLRRHGVAVTVVPIVDPPLPEAERWLRDAGCAIAEYKPWVFADRVVAAWCSPRFLTRLPEIHAAGRPRQTVYFNCMTDAHWVEKRCHAAGWLDRFGFVSAYQRGLLRQLLDPIRPVRELDGYRPFFNPDHALQAIAFDDAPPQGQFVVGRISRDDPLKFAHDTWSMFAAVDTGAHRKVVRILGYGDRVRRWLGPPPPGMECELHPPGAVPAARFYRGLHCILHRTGGSRESYCRVVPEAYAAGVAVIAEDDFAFRELVIDGETGFLCKSSEEMAERASEIAGDDNLRRRIIFAAREHLKTLASDPAKCWPAWEQLFAEVA